MIYQRSLYELKTGKRTSKYVLMAKYEYDTDTDTITYHGKPSTGKKIKEDMLTELLQLVDDYKNPEWQQYLSSLEDSLHNKRIK